MSNTHTLHALIRLATESARDEINKIDFRQLEETMADEQFKSLFDRICTIDETQKVIQEGIAEIMDGKPEEKPPLEINAFDTEKTVFRLFYMIRDELSRWRFSPYGKK